MKKYLIGLLAVFFITSCTTKKEEERPVEKPVVKHINVASKVIGENSNGQYVLKMDDAIAKHLEARLRESFALSENIDFLKFEIIKAITRGKGEKDAYLLHVVTSDKFILINLMLDFKEDKFYFRVNKESRGMLTEVIMCKKETPDSDCHPLVLFHNGSERLICESSGGCEKTGGEVWW
ncbi:MAG: hypothetical protein DI539_07475 [Flavobacterium psychrophilum]|nr:MAG: hypothetical protein DI539_07475 [Flavobacterium psychrophilum]